MIEKPWRERRLRADGPPISTSLTEAETAELQRLAAGNRCLEVGAAYGYSTVAMALVAEHVTSVDPHQWLNSWQACVANLRAYGVADRVAMVSPGDSQTVLPQLFDQGERFDLIYIDGDHEDGTVIHDIGWARKLLSPGGVLVCDDYDEVSCPGVRSALDRLLGPPPQLVDTFAIYDGLA
jgi:predicted O-methyltransferase YrrM